MCNLLTKHFIHPHGETNITKKKYSILWMTFVDIDLH